MGYNLHITRKDNWSDEDTSNDISFDEWLTYLKRDKEMRLDGAAVTKTSDGEDVSMVDDGLAVWITYSKEGVDRNYAWFWYDRGNIVVKNPDDEIIEKMKVIADALGGKVQGDDGEIYHGGHTVLTGAFGISKGWKSFMYVAVLLLVGLFGWVLIVGLRSNELWLQLFMGVVSLTAIAFFLYSLLESVTMRLIIDDNAISYKSVFKSTRLLFEEIKGIRTTEHEMVVVPQSKKLRSISVSKYLDRSSDLFNWLHENWGDLDRVERFEEEARILTSDEFGITSSSREFRLKQARRIAKVVNAIGVMTAIWLAFYPTPYIAAVLAGMIAPMLAIASVYFSPGLIRFDEKKNSPYPSVAYGFLFPACALAFRAAYDFEILEYGRIWITTAVLSVMLTGFILMRTREIKFSDWAGYIHAFLFGGLMMFYAFGVYVMINCEFDKSTPVVYHTEVAGKEISPGKVTSYYLKLKPWGPRKEIEKISVTKTQYQHYRPGDNVDVLLFAGLLDTPWCVLADR